jgi:lysophospholipase L1-like esterase
VKNCITFDDGEKDTHQAFTSHTFSVGNMKIAKPAQASPSYSKAMNRTSCFKFVTLVFVFVLFIKLAPPSIKPNVNVYSKISSSDLYATTPMCGPNGTWCGEDPDRPSPRTIYSAKSKEQYDLWWNAHAALNQSASEYASRRTTTSSRHENNPSSQTPTLRSLILLGDSITEAWIGTNMGLVVPRTRGVPDVLKKHLSSSENLDPLVLAIGGDQTQHLLYRLQHGQLLPAYAHDPNAIFIIMIGTNNLGSGILPGPTIKGVYKVADYVLQNTKGYLILMELLPRGDAHRLQKLCPPRCSSDGSPFNSFLPAVNKVNAAMREEIIPKLKEMHGENRVGLLDCGKPFRAQTNDNKHKKAAQVDASLMPDLLHPNADGHKLLAQCMLAYIKSIPSI